MASDNFEDFVRNLVQLYEGEERSIHISEIGDIRGVRSVRDAYRLFNHKAYRYGVPAVSAALRNVIYIILKAMDILEVFHISNECGNIYFTIEYDGERVRIQRISNTFKAKANVVRDRALFERALHTLFNTVLNGGELKSVPCLSDLGVYYADYISKFSIEEFFAKWFPHTSVVEKLSLIKGKRCAVSFSNGFMCILNIDPSESRIVVYYGGGRSMWGYMEGPRRTYWKFIGDVDDALRQEHIKHTIPVDLSELAKWKKVTKLELLEAIMGDIGHEWKRFGEEYYDKQNKITFRIGGSVQKMLVFTHEKVTIYPLEKWNEKLDIFLALRRVCAHQLSNAHEIKGFITKIQKKGLGYVFDKYSPKELKDSYSPEDIIEEPRPGVIGSIGDYIITTSGITFDSSSVHKNDKIESLVGGIPKTSKDMESSIGLLNIFIHHQCHGPLRISQANFVTRDGDRMSFTNIVNKFIGDAEYLFGASHTVSHADDVSDIIHTASTMDILHVVKFQKEKQLRYVSVRKVVVDGTDYLDFSDLPSEKVNPPTIDFGQDVWYRTLFEEILKEYILNYQRLGNAFPLKEYYLQYISKFSLEAFVRKYFPEATIEKDMTCEGYRCTMRLNGKMVELNDDTSRLSLDGVITSMGTLPVSWGKITPDFREYRNLVQRLRVEVCATAKVVISFDMVGSGPTRRVHKNSEYCNFDYLTRRMIQDIGGEWVEFCPRYYEGKKKIGMFYRGSTIVFHPDKIVIHPGPKKIQIEKIADLFRNLHTLPNDTSFVKDTYPHFLSRATRTSFEKTIRRFGMFLEKPIESIKVIGGYKSDGSLSTYPLLNDKYVFTQDTVAFNLEYPKAQNIRDEFVRYLKDSKDYRIVDMDVGKIVPWDVPFEAGIVSVIKELGEDYIPLEVYNGGVYIYHIPTRRLFSVVRSSIKMLSYDSITQNQRAAMFVIDLLNFNPEEEGSYCNSFAKDFVRESRIPDFEKELKRRYEYLRNVKMAFTDMYTPYIYIGKWCVFKNGNTAIPKTLCLSGIITAIKNHNIGLHVFSHVLSELMDMPFDAAMGGKLLEMLGEGYVMDFPSPKSQKFVITSSNGVVTTFEPTQITIHRTQPTPPPIPKSGTTYVSFLEDILRAIDDSMDYFPQYVAVTKIIVSFTLAHHPVTPETIKISKYIEDISRRLKDVECYDTAIGYVKWSALERLHQTSSI